MDSHVVMTQIYLLNVTELHLQMVKIVNFHVCIFYHNFKNKDIEVAQQVMVLASLSSVSETHKVKRES